MCFKVKPSKSVYRKYHFVVFYNIPKTGILCSPPRLFQWEPVQRKWTDEENSLFENCLPETKWFFSELLWKFIFVGSFPFKTSVSRKREKSAKINSIECSCFLFSWELFNTIDTEGKKPVGECLRKLLLNVSRNVGAEEGKPDMGPLRVRIKWGKTLGTVGLWKKWNYHVTLWKEVTTLRNKCV